MAIEFDPAEQWDRVALELRAFKQTQQQAWGDVDNATLGRYLADDLSPAERQHIEEALTQLPELRKLTDVVRDVLQEFDPAVPLPQPQEPKLLSFSAAHSAKKKGFNRIFRQRGALLAAACLLLGLGLTLGSMRMFTPPTPKDASIVAEVVALKQDPWEGASAAEVTPARGHLMFATAKKPFPLHERELTVKRRLDVSSIHYNGKAAIGGSMGVMAAAALR